MKRRPMIGVSGSMSKEEDRYFILRDYQRSLAEAGAIPLLLAPDMDREEAEECARRLDGLLLAGGNDVSPRCYGAAPEPGLGEVNPLRDACELEWIELFRREGKPIFAICRGIQILNAALGGDLIQDLSTYFKGKETLCHRQTSPAQYPSHRVFVKRDSLLFRLTGQETLWVNSFHHQAVGKLAPGATRSAWAEDGVTEAIELSEEAFVLGVQWHPERTTQNDEASRRLFEGFVKKCAGEETD